MSEPITSQDGVLIIFCGTKELTYLIKGDPFLEVTPLKAASFTVKGRLNCTI